MEILNRQNLYQMFESLLACRENRILEVLFSFRKDVFEELFLLQKMMNTLQMSMQISDNASVKDELSARDLFTTNGLYSRKQVDVTAEELFYHDVNRVEEKLDFPSSSEKFVNIKSELSEQLLEGGWSFTNEANVKENTPRVDPPHAIVSYSISTAPEPVNTVEIMTSDNEDCSKAFDQFAEPNSSDSSDGCQPARGVPNRNQKVENDLYEFIGSKYSATTSALQAAIESDTLKEKKEIRCCFCNKKFSRKLHLEEHLAVHTKEKRYRCLICSKLFCTRSGVQHHVKRHDSLTSHKCNICGKAFMQKSSLKNHIIAHTGGRLFKCRKCLKSYSRKRDLKLHMKLHSDVTDTDKEVKIVVPSIEDGL